jgi:hypothetical protein
MSNIEKARQLKVSFTEYVNAVRFHTSDSQKAMKVVTRAYLADLEEKTEVFLNNVEFLSKGSPDISEKNDEPDTINEIRNKKFEEDETDDWE